MTTAESPVLLPGVVDGRVWRRAGSGDRDVVALYERHYSARRYRDGRRRPTIVGPGERLVLMTYDGLALFVWRRFRNMDPAQVGINCAVFRNEGPILSSDLIRSAVDLARERWPGERLYTYVDGSRVRSSNPGYCFLRAGWTRCGTSSDRGLAILELRSV